MTNLFSSIRAHFGSELDLSRWTWDMLVRRVIQQNEGVTFGENESAFLGSVCDGTVELARGRGVDFEFVLLLDKLRHRGHVSYTGDGRTRTRGTFLMVGRETPARASSG